MKQIIFKGILLCAVAVFSGAFAEESMETDSSWNHSSQLSAALSGGNSDSKTLSLSQDTGYKWGSNLLKSGAHYLLGEAGGLKSAENWHFDLRYERELSERFSIYAGPGIAGDKFAGFDTRISVGAGAKYWILPGDKKVKYLFTEAGYKYEKQNNVTGTTPPDTDNHFLRSYFEGSISFSEGITGKLWVEVMPDISEGSNIQINFEPSLSMAMSSHFALKLAFTGRYDGLPNVGKEKFDYLYTTSLVATY